MKNLSTMTYTKAQKRFEKIHQLFSMGGNYKTKDLMDIFNCSDNTILNDTRDMRKKGLICKVGHSYYMPEEFRVNTLLDNADMGLSMISSMFVKALPQMKDYLDGMLVQRAKNSDIFRFDFNLETINDVNIISKIVAAINTKVAISFTYSSKNGKKSDKNAYPLSISNFDGFWYVIAYDLEKGSLRTYHIEQINDIETLEDDFLGSKREKLEKEAKNIHSAWYKTDVKTVKLKVVDVGVEYIKRKSYPNITIEEDKGTELYLQMTYYNNIEVLNFVKRWLPYIKIIDHKELNMELKNLLKISIENL